MRLVLRVLGTWLLGVALILLIIDGTKSLGANSLVLTAFGDSWNAIHAESLMQVRGFLETRFFGPLLTLALDVPGWAVLGVPGIVLAWLGRSKRSRMFVKQDQI